MLLLNCALKLVEQIILYYDARSKKNIKLLITGCLYYMFRSIIWPSSGL